MQKNIITMLENYNTPYCDLENHRKYQYLKVCINPQCSDYLKPFCVKCLEKHPHEVRLILLETLEHLADLVKNP